MISPTRKCWALLDQHKFWTTKQTSLNNSLTSTDRNSHRNLESIGSPRPVYTTQASGSKIVTTTTIVSIFSRPKKMCHQELTISSAHTTKTAITSLTQSASSRFPNSWAPPWKMCLTLQKYSRVRNTQYLCLMGSNVKTTILSSPTKWCSWITSTTENLKSPQIRWWYNSSCRRYQGTRNRIKTGTSENRIL